MDLFLQPFMLRALVAAAVTGLAAPAVGTYLVQRRLSLMGDGIGHVCVTGVALGLLTGTSPTLTAVVVAIVGAFLIELIRSSGKATGDVALALLFYGGIAGGLLLGPLGGNGIFALQQYLFGSITTISLPAVVASVRYWPLWCWWCLWFALLPQLFSVANDEDFARTTGLPVRSRQRADLGARRRDGEPGDAHGRPAAGQRADDHPGGDGATVLTRFPDDHAGRDGGGAPCGHRRRERLGLRRAHPPGATIVLVSLAGFAITAPVGLVVQRRCCTARERRSRCRSSLRPTCTTPWASRTDTSTARAAGTRPSSTATTS